MIDCVEFSERLRYGDVASEIAFLAMDLDRLGAPMLADELVEAYAEITGDEDLAVFVPFYKCYRACVRGKVESLRSLEREVGAAERERARRLASELLHAGLALCASASPRLIVVCGLSGIGQIDRRAHASASQGLQGDQLGPRSQRLASVSPHEHVRTDYGANIYSDRFTKITYDAMLAEAEHLLGEGCGAILDATFKEPLPTDNSHSRWPPVAACRCSSSNASSAKTKLYAGSSVANRYKVKCRTPRQRCYQKQRAEFEPIREIPPRNHLRMDTTRRREQLVARNRGRARALGWRLKILGKQ